MSNREVRGGVPAEVRADASGVKVTGYAAVFNQAADIGGMFIETIMPGAFAKAIGRDNVPLLIEHEGLPLARNRSGTLKLSEDDHGLHIESNLDASDPDVQRIVPKMQRGDLDKMSFAFVATREEWDWAAEPPRRSIFEVELFDVSIVTMPAFDGTSIAMRSLAAARAKKEHPAHKRIAERKARTEQVARGIR